MHVVYALRRANKLARNAVDDLVDMTVVQCQESPWDNQNPMLTDPHPLVNIQKAVENGDL